MAQLEERQQVDRSIIDRALEEPSFGALLQKALIGSAQTESEDKHELLAKLVAMKLAAQQESVLSIVTPLACEVITHLTLNQLKILGIQSVLMLIHPSFSESDIRTEGDFLNECSNWLTIRLAPFMDVPIRRVDLLHLESLSCVKVMDLADVEYPLAGKLEFWKCRDFKFTLDKLYELPIGATIKTWRDTQGLNQVSLTTTGQLLGLTAVENMSRIPMTLAVGAKTNAAKTRPCCAATIS